MSKIDNASQPVMKHESAEQEDAVVEVTGLTKRFGDIFAVDEADFKVFDGEFFSIIGPSGSGKTTLLRMIGGFEEPTAGSISIRGRECTYDKPYHRNTNMIFQSLALFPHLNVKENVEYGLVEAGVTKDSRKEKVKKALQTVDLEGYIDREINELSGGEQQRVALARGLVNEPSVLLLDEPLASLDEKLKETMKVELKRIQERTDTTFVYVTHDQEVAMAMSDRIAIVNDGKVQQIASPQEMYNNPSNTFVADFTGAKNIFDVSIANSSGQDGTVVLDDLEFYAKLSEEVANGDAEDYQMIIRPEEITISPNEGRVTGTVTDVVYKGALMDVMVEVDTGSNIVQFEAEIHSEIGGSISEGEEVYIGWKDRSPLVVRN